MMSSRIMILFFIMTQFWLNGAAQDLDPVDWHIYTDKKSKSDYSIYIEATIKDEWVIYSMSSPEGGPIATNITFNAVDGVELQSKVFESTTPTKEFEELFGQEVVKFSDRALFIQDLKSFNKSVIINGTITYMACNGRQCLPPRQLPIVAVLN